MGDILVDWIRPLSALLEFCDIRILCVRFVRDGSLVGVLVRLVEVFYVLVWSRIGIWDGWIEFGFRD